MCILFYCFFSSQHLFNFFFVSGYSWAFFVCSITVTIATHANYIYVTLWRKNILHWYYAIACGKKLSLTGLSFESLLCDTSHQQKVENQTVIYPKMSQMSTSKNVCIHKCLDYKCHDIRAASKCLHFSLYVSTIQYVTACHSSLWQQIWWEQAVNMTVWSTVMGRASSPAANTSVCVWTVPSAVCHCARSPNLHGCGAKPHVGSKYGDNAVSNGSVMNPREGARRPRDTQ